MKKTSLYFVFGSLFVFAGLFALSGCASGGNPLKSTAWTLTAINGNPVIEGTEPYLIFDKDSVGGSSGCNNTGGEYKVNGSQISFDDLFSTEMYCMEPEGVMDQEANFLAALSKAATFTISGNRMTIQLQDGGSLNFVSRPQS